MAVPSAGTRLHLKPVEMRMIENIEDFFTRGCGRCARFDTPDCSVRIWNPGLLALREICLEAGLEETVRWAHPCYRHGDRNVALIGALRGDFRLNFFHAALMTDPAGILEKQGPNTRHPDSIRFTSLESVTARRDTILAYLREAKDYAERGLLPPKEPAEIELPEELVDALDADPDMAEAFHRLTPGRQRSYVINLNGAKKAETRIARIAAFRNQILAGKGAQER
ncbi:YdeI/OmpD-associated family protein [Gellertiella hungarica]